MNVAVNFFLIDVCDKIWALGHDFRSPEGKCVCERVECVSISGVCGRISGN